MTEYLYPRSIKEATQCLAAHKGSARVIAGGTDVLPDVRKGRVAPRCLVDITRIPILGEIEVARDFVTIGAAVTFGVIREHPFLRQELHALVDAAGAVGAGAIQNAATLVGNIVQAMPAADGSVVAVALDGEARIEDCNGAGWQPVESLWRGPGVSAVDPTRQLVTHIRFPRPGSNTGTAWRRVGRRQALVLPILNCAVTMQIDGSDVGSPKVVRVAIALGPVAPRPFRAREAETFLRGRALTERALSEAGRLAQTAANPRTSVMRASREYRLAIVPTLVGEALAQAARRAMG
jgi:carbon-monoxide dehydrogenase medium subunit